MASRGATIHVKGYTVLLWLFGFVLAYGAMTFHTLADGESGDARAFEMIGNSLALVAVGCLVVAAVRSMNFRVAGTATAAISIILALSFPLGTAMFLWWLLSVRKRERFEDAAG